MENHRSNIISGRNILIILAIVAGSTLVKAQTTIATGLPGCLPVTSQVGVSCGGGTTQFGVVGNQFIVRNVDGAVCCTPSGGDGASYFQFATLNISNFSNVNISMAYSADPNTSYEDDSPTAPVFGCQGMSQPDNSHDQMVFMYSLDGGPFEQSLYVHGTTGADFTGTWTEGPLNGNTLTIRVYAANKSQAEIFYFQTLNITGTSTLTAGPDQTICGLTPVDMQGSGTGTWTGGAGSFSSTTDPEATYTPAASEAGSSVTLTYSGAPAYTGCPAPTDQMVLTINNTPQPVITGNPTSCSNVTLTASGGGAGATYQWNGGNNAGNATNTFITSGTYIVTVTNTSNCTATAEVVVTISPPPIASITGPTTSCGNITLTASGAGNNGTYQWSGGSNPTMAANTFTASGTYTVTVTDANGCTATSSQAITVSTPPNVTISGNTTGCNTVTLTASGGGTGGTYAWSGGNNPGNAVNTFTMSGTYVVTVTNSSGCTATASATVTVNQGPAGTLSGSATLCPNQCATFSFTFTSGSQPYTLQLTASPPGINFTIPGVNTSQTFQICYQGFLPPNYNPSTNTITIPTFLTGTGSLALTGISDASGCPGTASGSFSLTLTNAPTATSANLTLCETTNGQATFNLTTLNSTIIGGGSGVTVNWFQDMAGTIPISNPSAYTTGSTTVYAQVSNGGCTSPLVAVNLTVEPSTVPFTNMFCAESGTPACTICLTGGNAELQFVFGDNRNYNVTVKNLTTNANITGLVNNSTNLVVPVTGTTTFQLETIQPAPGCPNSATYTNQVTITVVPPPDINPLTPPPTCDEFILPVITGTNLSGNQGYFTGAGGTGTQYFPGQAITMSLTLYMYDENAGCEDEETVNIVILPPVTFDQLQDLEGCESVVLPAITGPGVSTSAYYNTAQDGTGTTYLPGAVVTQSLTLYAIDPQADPACVTNVLELEVTINPLPAPADITVDCGGGNGNGIATINSPTGNEYSYSIDGLPFQPSTQFTGLNNGSHIITIKNTDTDCQRETTFQVSCDCATPAVINLSPVSGIVCEGQIFTSGQIVFSGNTNQVTLSSNGAGNLSPLIVNSSPFTFSYTPASADLGKTILITLETNDPDGPGPCAPETRSFSLTVRNNPTAGISGPAVVCKGSPATLTAQGGVTFLWSSNGGTQSIATFARVDSTTTYQVTVTDAFGCKDDAAFTVSTQSATAGRDSTSAFCNSTPQTINLFSFLSTGASTTGVWKLGNDTIKVPTSYVVTSLPLGINILRYIINDPICGKDTSLFRLEIRSKNNAGLDSQFSLCGGSLSEFDFDSSLGVHDSNGRWLQGAGTSLVFTDPSSVDVTSLKPGQYGFTYIVAGNGCDPDSATVRLTITPFNSAGPDIDQDACAGSSLDFRTIIPNFLTNGSILNPNNYPGLNGVTWNTTGLAKGTYSFIYRVNNVAPCQADEALIFIELLQSLNPGQGKAISSCQGKIVDLTSLLSPDADQGGVFYLNGVKLTSSLLTIPAGNSPLTIQYEVGDDVSCPKKRASFTINPIVKPSVQLAPVAPICDGACQSLSLTNGSGTAVKYFLSSVQQPGSLSFSTTLSSTAQGQSVTQICAASAPPYSFVRLPVSSVFTINVDSVEVQGCVYPDGSTTQLTIKPLNTRSFTKTICKSETIKIGMDVYSFTKPAGQTRIVSQNPQACDTLVDVQLQFFPDAIGAYSETFCDETKTVTVGGQVFSKLKPAGTVTLKNASSRGCDSLVNVTIFYEKQTIPGAFSLKTCDLGYQLKLGTTTFSAANPTGTALLVGAAREGCDSLVQVNLIFEELSAQTSLSYTCESSGGMLSISNPSHTGPFTIVADAGLPVVVGNLPYKLNLSPGAHTVSVTGAGGCTRIFPVLVEDKSAPQVTVTQTPLQDGTIQLTAVDNPQGAIYNIAWTPSTGISCQSCLTPVVNPQETTTYTMSYLFGTDCPGSQQITVKRINTTVVIPNIFTPDGNGRNDVFFIPLPDGVTGTVKEMAIYDRWGNRVFFTENVPANDPSEGWRGTYQGQQVVPGVFVYRVILQVNGKASEDVFAGSVTVIK